MRKMPRKGERWTLLKCPHHDNLPGTYIWQGPPLHDPSVEESIIRIDCG